MSGAFQEAKDDVRRALAEVDEYGGSYAEYVLLAAARLYALSSPDLLLSQQEDSE